MAKVRMTRKGLVKVVDELRNLSLDELRESYRADRARSRLDNRSFDSMVLFAIECGEMHSLGYKVDLPVSARDFRPLAIAVAARTLATFTVGEKRPTAVIGDRYDPRRKRA